MSAADRPGAADAGASTPVMTHDWWRDLLRSPDRPQAIFRYAIAFAITLWCVWMAQLFHPLIGSATLLPLVLAVVFSAAYGGVGPGVLAATVSVVAADVVVLPASRLHLPGRSDAVELALFFLVALLVSWAAGALRRSRAVARHDASRVAFLQSVTEALLATSEPVQVGEVLIVHLRASFGDVTGALIVRGDNDEWLELPLTPEPEPAVALAIDSPAHDVLRTGRAFHGRVDRAISPSGCISMLPMVLGAESVGVLSVSCPQDGPFSHADRAMLSALAQLGAQALERTRLLHKERSVREQLFALHEMSTRLIGVHDRDVMLQQILDAVIELQRADCGHFQVTRPDSGELAVVAQRGFEPRQLADLGTTEGVAAWDLALERGTRVLIEDVETGAPDIGRRIAQRGGYRAVQSTPLFGRQGEPLGVLSTQFRRPHRPSDLELRMTDLYMRHAAELIQRESADAQLRYAKEMAETSNRAKSQFLAVMSHELRTPLNAILGYADLMDAQVAGPLQPMQQRHVSRIHASARLLIDLVDEVLTYARVEAGKEQVRLAPVQLGEVVHTAATLVEPGAAAKGIALNVDVDDEHLQLLSDAAKLRQVLLNLLSNAVKFTDSGRVDFSATRAGDRLVFRVRDTGPGILLEDRDRIFDPFTQSDSSPTRTKGGTGLGLAVAARLARLLGAELVLEESEPGRGSTFALHHPLHPSSTGSDDETSALAAGYR